MSARTFLLRSFMSACSLANAFPISWSTHQLVSGSFEQQRSTLSQWRMARSTSSWMSSPGRSCFSSSQQRIPPGLQGIVEPPGKGFVSVVIGTLFGFTPEPVRWEGYGPLREARRCGSRTGGHLQYEHQRPYRRLSFPSCSRPFGGSLRILQALNISETLEVADDQRPRVAENGGSQVSRDAVGGTEVSDGAPLDMDTVSEIVGDRSPGQG